MKCIFFYGLFMDVALLQGKGLEPVPVGRAALAGYRICIGARAALVPCKGYTSYGLAMEMSDADVAELYAMPGVADYRPQSVDIVFLSDGSVREAFIYNLSAHELGDVADAAYARKLAALVTELGFSRAYADEISRFADG